MFRQKGSTDLPIVFFMADETDHETGLTGLTCAVTLSKNGGAFGAALGTVSELGGPARNDLDRRSGIYG